ncbi:MAG: hypothetical protein WDN28_31405 [Chthoniobacter sp.]
MIALRDLLHRGFTLPAGMLERALRWLVERQDPCGGWSGAKDGPVSVEETALAVEALAGTEDVIATDRGTAWLVAQVESGQWTAPAPIGFYFAKLMVLRAPLPTHLDRRSSRENRRAERQPRAVSCRRVFHPRDSSRPAR